MVSSDEGKLRAEVGVAEAVRESCKPVRASRVHLRGPRRIVVETARLVAPAPWG
jgi:hypothetical protein